MLAPSSLAEVLGSLSLASDLATGSAAESGLRATVLATRLGELAGLDSERLAVTYYASITRMLGCTSTAVEGAALALGSDQLLNQALIACDWDDPTQVERAVDHYLPAEVASDERRAAVAGIVELQPTMADVARMHCAQAVMIAGRLPLPPGVTDILGHMYDRWDGRYAGQAGRDIPLPARITPVAFAAELSWRSGGPAGVAEMTRARGGGQFDPELCTAIEDHAAELFEGFDAPSVWDCYLDSEPRPARGLGPEDVVAVAEAFGDFVDQKSGWFSGHSRRVAMLAADAAEELGLPNAERDKIRLSGLVHDIGRAAVANGVWDKPDGLTPRERQLVESHSYHTESVLGMAPALAELAGAAGAVHERLDGSGYHRRVRCLESAPALLAAADVYDALTHERPWRPAFDADQAVEEMRRLCADGVLHADCTTAVLNCAGADRQVQPAYPAGLTPREVQVLQLLAAGLPTKTIATRLFISNKTADHHIQSIYDKTGARGRAVAALFALEHGLTTE